MKRLWILSAVAALMLGVAPACAAPPSFKIVQRVSGPDGFWDYASFDPVHRTLYVSHGDAIMTVQTDTGKVNPRFADASRSPCGAAARRRARAPDHQFGATRPPVSRRGQRQAPGLLPTAAGPDAAALDPATGHVFVIDGDSGHITVIDPSARKAVGYIDVGGEPRVRRPRRQGQALRQCRGQEPGRGHRHAQGLSPRALSAAGCQGPTGLAYAADDLWSPSCGSGAVKVLSPAGQDLQTFKIGAGPDAVISDPSHARLYVPSGRAGTLAIFDVRAGRLTAAGVVQTQAGARTGAIDPRTQRIYLPTANFTPPPAPGQRPRFVPGSFQVLVLAPG